MTSEQPLGVQVGVADGLIHVHLSEMEALIISDLLQQVRHLLSLDQAAPTVRLRLGPEGLGLDEATPASTQESGAAPDPSVEELEALVGMRQGPMHPPTDPALARLLPDAYAEDSAASSDFRRFTEQDLRQHKTAQIDATLASLAPEQEDDQAGQQIPPDDLVHRYRQLHLLPEQAQAWLSALNDVRLVMGTRLQVSEDDDLLLWLDEQQQPTTPTQQGLQAQAMRAVYDYLTAIQEHLVEAVCALHDEVQKSGE